jgi:hypothetical protein
VVWAPRAASAREASILSQRIFDEAAGRGLHLALSRMPVSIVDPRGEVFAPDAPTVSCLRSVLMKPEHADWTDRIVAILGDAASAATGSGMS